MAENDDGTLYRWRFTSPVIKIAKLKQPSGTVVSQEFALLIGQCLIAWSGYEQAFAFVMEAFLRHANALDEGWNRLSYRKKANRLLRLLDESYKAHPAMVALLSDTLSDSRDAHARRNVIAHGEMSWTGKLVGGEMHPSMVATGEVGGKKVAHDYTEDELEDLVYDLMHLDGRMGEFASRGSTEWLARELPSADMSLLRDVCATMPPRRPAT